MIEMLRSWTETFRTLLQSAFSWTEDDDMLWARQLVTMVKKKNGKLTMRGFHPMLMLPAMYRLFFKDLAAVGGPGYAHST